jgi:hypothetical protein
MGRFKYFMNLLNRLKPSIRSGGVTYFASLDFGSENFHTTQKGSGMKRPKNLEYNDEQWRCGDATTSNNIHGERNEPIGFSEREKLFPESTHGDRGLKFGLIKKQAKVSSQKLTPKKLNE